jgi:hypothetical protein
MPAWWEARTIEWSYACMAARLHTLLLEVKFGCTYACLQAHLFSLTGAWTHKRLRGRTLACMHTARTNDCTRKHTRLHAPHTNACTHAHFHPLVFTLAFTQICTRTRLVLRTGACKLVLLNAWSIACKHANVHNACTHENLNPERYHKPTFIHSNACTHATCTHACLTLSRNLLRKIAFMPHDGMHELSEASALTHKKLWPHARLHVPTLACTCASTQAGLYGRTLCASNVC